MARKAKIEPISSRNYSIRIAENFWWVVKNESGAETADSFDFDEYRKLKRIWRKSKTEFEDILSKMQYRNLFNRQGM